MGGFRPPKHKMETRWKGDKEPVWCWPPRHWSPDCVTCRWVGSSFCRLLHFCRVCFFFCQCASFTAKFGEEIKGSISFFILYLYKIFFHYEHFSIVSSLNWDSSHMKGCCPIWGNWNIIDVSVEFYIVRWTKNMYLISKWNYRMPIEDRIESWNALSRQKSKLFTK